MPTCKPLRAMAGELDDRAAARRRSAHGWNEPTRIAGAIVRAEPAALARGAGRELGELGHDAALERVLARRCRRPSAAAIAAELGGLDDADASPACTRRSASAYADGDLVYTASSMPIRDQEAFLRRRRRRRPVSRQPRRQRDRRPDLVGDRRRGGHRPADLDRHRRPRALPRHERARQRCATPTAPVRIVVINNDGGGIFEFLPQAEQIDRDEFEAMLGTPLGLDPERVAELHGIAHRGSSASTSSPAPPPPARR